MRITIMLKKIKHQVYSSHHGILIVVAEKYLDQVEYINRFFWTFLSDLNENTLKICFC